MRSNLFAGALASTLVALAAPAAAAPETLWELGSLREPESVLPAGDVLYVSNVVGDFRGKDGVGFISKVSPEGKMIAAEWVSGLNAPKGLGLVGGTLYVADIDELVEIDVASAKITKRHPAPGAGFLNDVATDASGRVFVSDTATDTIWALEDGRFEPWVKSEKLKGPNGLLVERDRLVVAAIGTIKDGKPEAPANLVEVTFADKSVRDLGDGSPVGFLDGLAALGDGAYLASDYGKGPIYRIEASGAFTTLMEFGPGTADLAFAAGDRIAYVPLSKDGKLLALRLP